MKYTRNSTGDVVEAIQYTGENGDDVLAFSDPVEPVDTNPGFICSHRGPLKRDIYPGQWLTKDSDGRVEYTNDLYFRRHYRELKS